MERREFSLKYYVRNMCQPSFVFKLKINFFSNIFKSFLYKVELSLKYYVRNIFATLVLFTFDLFKNKLSFQNISTLKAVITKAVI